MASQTNLKQRTKDGPSTTATPAGPSVSSSARNGGRAKKLAMAKRGLRSLATAVAVPFLLTALAAYLSGGCTSSAAAVYAGRPKPMWHPQAWFFHVASASTACLMGLSAWLVWAEGGFHSEPMALPVYAAQFLAGLLWGPLVMGRAGAPRAGIVACAVLCASLLGCARCFGKVNPIAGDLVKPCLAWAAFVALFNYSLLA